MLQTTLRGKLVNDLFAVTNDHMLNIHIIEHEETPFHDNLDKKAGLHPTFVQKLSEITDS